MVFQFEIEFIGHHINLPIIILYYHFVFEILVAMIHW